jgi:hypothetical protein
MNESTQELIERLERQNKKMETSAITALLSDTAQCLRELQVQLAAITQLQAEVEALRKDAARYQKHCRNAQVAAWCGIDPYAPDVLKQLDAYIDAAIAKDTQLSALGKMVKISQEMGLYEPPIVGEAK